MLVMSVLFGCKVMLMCITATYGPVM